MLLAGAPLEQLEPGPLAQEKSGPKGSHSLKEKKSGAAEDGATGSGPTLGRALVKSSPGSSETGSNLWPGAGASGSEHAPWW